MTEWHVLALTGVVVCAAAYIMWDEIAEIVKGMFQ